METKAQPTLSVEVKQEVTFQRISDLLCSAFEGGSNYWYCIEKYQKPTAFTFFGDSLDLVREGEDPTETFRYLTYPLNKGGKVYITTDDEDKEYILNLDSIKRGLKVMARDYPRHFNEFLQENDDASTGDVFLQCCLFGEVVYG